MYTLIILVILVACAGLVWMQGLWGAAVTLLSLLFAGLLATNLCFLLGDVLDSALPTYTYFWDFLSFWLIFCFIFLVLRAITDAVSKTRVRFILPVEMAGRSVFALVAAWIMVCLVCFSLHMAPIPTTGFRGGFQPDAMSKDFLGVAPDQHWLVIVYAGSRGSLSSLFEKHFAAPSDFIRNYRVRRSDLERIQRNSGSFRVK